MWSYRTLLSSLCRRALKDGGQTGKDFNGASRHHRSENFFAELGVGTTQLAARAAPPDARGHG